MCVFHISSSPASVSGLLRVCFGKREQDMWHICDASPQGLTGMPYYTASYIVAASTRVICMSTLHQLPASDACTTNASHRNQLRQGYVS